MAAPYHGSKAGPQFPEVPPLKAGDRLDQRTFHERYEAMPKHVQAELIGGIVYMPSPLKVPHGRWHARLISWLQRYSDATPGTDVLDNATTILADDSEPQPDGSLYILPECGGQTYVDAEQYLVGAPELVGEVALTSVEHDLRAKRDDYERAGVQEYVVIVVEGERVVWFRRSGQGFEPLEPGLDGIFRSQVFSGLWLDAAALFREDRQRPREVLMQGLASLEHARLVERLKPTT